MRLVAFLTSEKITTSAFLSLWYVA